MARNMIIVFDGNTRIAYPPSPRLILDRYRLLTVHLALLLFISLLLVQIQASPSALYPGVYEVRQSDRQAWRLEPGKPIERELTGGQSHSYQIAMASGQYMHLVVDQRGIDVVVALFTP